MIRQLVLVDLVCQSYSPIPDGVFDRVLQYEDATACLKRVDDTLVIAMPGTEDFANVMSDLEIEPYHHPVLGEIHMGFYKPIPGLGALLLPYLQNGLAISIAGHSLGAARAALLACWLKISGITVDQLSLYACPRIGTHIIEDYLLANIPNGISFVNGIDPVPDLPPEYDSPYPAIKVIADPGGVADIDPARWHSCALYREAITKELNPLQHPRIEKLAV